MGQPQDNQGNSSKGQNEQNQSQARDARKELGEQNRQKSGQKDEPQGGEQSQSDPQNRGGTQGEKGGEPPSRQDDTPPWFAALPPEIRDAIDAGRGEEIPAKYQEIVRRYNLWLQQKAKRNGR